MSSGTLVITIVSARNLKLMDRLERSNDPYVQIKLGHQKVKTQVKPKAGSEAEWNETFQLGFIERFTELHLEVFDKDRMADDVIGRTAIPISSIVENRSVDSWYMIGKGDKTTGEVRAKIQFQPGNFPEDFDPAAVDWESNAKFAGTVAGGVLAAAAAGYGAKLAYDHYKKPHNEEQASHDEN